MFKKMADLSVADFFTEGKVVIIKTFRQENIGQIHFKKVNDKRYVGCVHFVSVELHDNFGRGIFLRDVQ